MHYMQKKTINMILLKNLHYVIQVKRNQKTLFNYLEQTSIQKPLDTHEYSEKSHGRQTKWNVSVFSISSKSKFISQWKECKRLIEVRKTCIKLKTRKKSESIRYYISNLLYMNGTIIATSIPSNNPANT